ncbi:TSUP family transporter [Planktotalea sp.]|uniref:TSUP family transporter n=1 Tax=Planktotalea sp. TaxID=2029877 RepID=UPI0035C7FA0E
MTELLDLTTFQIATLALISFAAGIVRGFAGFALSALVMASAATIISPISLIPVLWFLEMAASLQMAGGVWRDANRTIAILLVVGNFIGWPIGLTLTTSLPTETSTLIALCIILALAALQLARLRIPGLATRPGTLISGIVTGIAAGVAHVGGMVVALYVLSQNQPAKMMRGTLVVYLFLASFGSFLFLMYFDVMTWLAATRGLVFAPVAMLGVFVGTKFFSPKWEPYYRPFCLSLLMFLASLGLIRLAL